MRHYPPSRSAWVAVDAQGLPVYVWPGREAARERGRRWLRRHDREDLRLVPLEAMTVGVVLP